MEYNNNNYNFKVGNAAGTVVFRSVMDLPPITFKRPCLDEPDIEMLCEYALPIIFHQLSRVLFFFLSFTLFLFLYLILSSMFFVFLFEC